MRVRIGAFTSFLKEIMTKLDGVDSATMDELEAIIERFNFSLAMFNKFREIFERVGFHSARYGFLYTGRRRSPLIKYNI